MDRLDELDILVAVVETGSLRGAAARLRRSGSAVTRAIATLEDRLGRRLLDRTTRRLSVTEAGHEAYSAAREMLATWKALAAQDKGAPVRGLVRLTAPVMFGQLFVAPAVDLFLQRWPEASAEMLLDDHYLDFIEHGLDAAVRLGNLPDSTLRAARVGAVRWVTVASPTYLAEHGIPQSPRDLASHVTIAESARSGRPNWSFARRGQSETVMLEPRILSNDIQVQLAAARAGRGIARVLNYHAAADFKAGTLMRMLKGFEAAEIPVQVVSTGGRHVDGKTRAIVDHLVDTLRPKLAAMARG